MSFFETLTALPQQTTLPNGIRVFFRRTQASGLVSVQVWVKSGSVHEGQFLGSGISHFLEHMVFKGTERFSAEAISQKVQALGGSINAYTTFSRTVFYVDLPSESAETAFEILSQMTLFPKLDADDAAREKDVVLREIAMGEDDPDQKLFEATAGTTFRVHPLRFPIIGKRELFERLDAGDLKTYFESRYASDTINVVVAGDADAEIIFSLSEKFFGGVPMRKACEAFIPAEPPQLAPREVTVRGDVKVLRGNVLWKVPGLAHEDAPALGVLASLLGKGDSALLWNELHEKRELVHALDATTWNPAGEGLFWISYVADLDKRAAVESALAESVEKIVREGVAPALLKKASRQALVGLVNSRRTVSAAASRLGMETVELGEPEVTRIFLEKISTLTPKAIQHVAEKYLVEKTQTRSAFEKAAMPKTQNAAATSKKPSMLSAPPFESLTLDNGVRVLLQPIAGFPKVHLRATMRAGGAFESSLTKGASALLSTLLTLDAGTRTAAEVAEAIESVGGIFDEQSGNNSLSLAAETLSDDVAVACDVLRAALLEPHFSDKNFVRERDSQSAALLSEYDEIEDFARIALRERFFGERCFLGTHAYGTEQSLAALTLADVRALYEKIVVPENLVISASGEFERDALAETLNRAFGAFRGTQKFRLPEIVFPEEQTVAREQKIAFDGEQAIIQLAFPDVGFCDERRFAATLAEELLCGMASRLFLEVREKRGLAYFVGANRTGAPRFGMFSLYAGTEKSATETVFAEMHKEMARLRNGEISDEELRGAKVRVCVARRTARQKASVRASSAALNAIYGLSVNADVETERRLNAVTRDDIVRFAAEVLSDARSLKLTVA